MQIRHGRRPYLQYLRVLRPEVHAVSALHAIHEVYTVVHLTVDRLYIQVMTAPTILVKTSWLRLEKMHRM